MKIAVIGTGYVGLTTGTCFAEMGNSVICVDIDEKKIQKLQKSESPIYEPGLEELLKRNIKSKRLLFTQNIQEAIEESEIIMCAVGTPPDKQYRPDLTQVENVAKDTGKYMNGYKLFVMKSTVPVGTNESCKAIIQGEFEKRNVDFEFDIASNPEFLKQGAAIKDTMNPDRVIVGIESNRAKKLMEKLFKPIVRTGKPLMFTNIRSAELIKYAANAFLSTKISFINELAGLCEKAGGDVREVARGIGLDDRIGARFLQAGIGYGGNCLKKDIRALIYMGEKFKNDLDLLKVVEEINENQKTIFVQTLISKFKSLKAKKIAIWGLSFKPKTDDMRDAPSLDIINQLKAEGADVCAYDPVAITKEVQCKPTMYDAAKDAEALLVLTEWDEFRNPDLKKLKSEMNGNLIMDGRNIYDPETLRNFGFEYAGIGTK